jgi:4-aminobutyrate--pyruvate transaminase
MVGDVRGVGLIFGVELVADRDSRTPFPPDVKPGLMIQAAAKRRGLLMRASPGFVGLGPPLITTEADIDQILEILDASIEEVQAELLPQ